MVVLSQILSANSKNGCLRLIIIYWRWNLSHQQVYGSDTESNVTLKVTRVGGFS